MKVPDRSLFHTALDWLEEGRAVAIATVLKTWGSSPCPAGAMLLVDSAGNFQGSVSGGCVEAAVIATAADCIAAQKPATLHFAVSNDQAWEVGLACGGEIKIFVQAMADAAGMLGPALLRQVVAAQDAQQSLALLWDLPAGGVTACRDDSALPHDVRHDESVRTAIRQALTGDDCQLLERPEGSVFIQPLNPPLRLLIIGAVHIAQALAPMAASCGYQVIIIDPRESFASRQRFPEVALNHNWPDAALRALRPDHRTAVVTLTHDPKLDEPALAVALSSAAFYIGALGSRRTHATRLKRLAERGISAALAGRICAPVGLDIRARSAAEIALAIMAEMTQTLRTA